MLFVLQCLCRWAAVAVESDTKRLNDHLSMAVRCAEPGDGRTAGWGLHLPADLRSDRQCQDLYGDRGWAAVNYDELSL